MITVYKYTPRSLMENRTNYPWDSMEKCKEKSQKSCLGVLKLYLQIRHYDDSCKPLFMPQDSGSVCDTNYTVWLVRKIIDTPACFH